MISVQFPALPSLIQGGMGVGVSGWRLARAVSMQGQLGVVSGTGINNVLIRRLQDGDAEGDARRAISRFPDATFAEVILERFFKPGGRRPNEAYRLSPMPVLKPSVFAQQLLALAAFVEVYLAKEDHAGKVGINLLEKIQLSNLASLYGAMLAGVDYVLMGAGIPREIPGALDQLSRHEEAALRIAVDGAQSGTEYRASFNPREVFPDIFPGSFNDGEFAPLERPAFIGIVSSATLATHLARKSNGTVQGFVIEGSTAGGHNAPPRGALQLNANGEPVYGAKDVADLNAIRELGLPFWLAGSFGSPERMEEARAMGAAGIQVGTAFAFCKESGVTDELKAEVILKWGSDPGSTKRENVFTDPLASPTSFPFKVVPIDGTVSDPQVYEARARKCDLGYLRQAVAGADGKVTYRCPSEPVADFVRKGGKLEETVGRKCLCNALMANIGMGQTRGKDEHVSVEPALLTAGDDIIHLWKLIPPGASTYTARDVIRYLLPREEAGKIA